MMLSPSLLFLLPEVRLQALCRSEFLDLQIEVAKRTSQGPSDGKKASYNVYFNRLIGRGDPGAATQDRLTTF